MAKTPFAIHRRMIEVLQQHPQGLTFGQWRKKLQLAEDEQGQLDRRKRDLYKWFAIEKVTIGRHTLYFYKGERKKALGDTGVSLKDRAKILHEACGQCGMCGRTIAGHGIVLVVDHKIPQDWGGSSQYSNLWAICQDCNEGKKNYFAAYDKDLMRAVMHHGSVHLRIGELLKAHVGQPVPAYLIAFVAGKDDWQKRTRELRYLKWTIKVSKKRTPAGKVESYYTLRKYTEWPDNPTLWIQQYERHRAKRNKAEAS